MKKMFNSLLQSFSSRPLRAMSLLVAILAVCIFLTGFIINNVVFRLPEQNGFSLEGRKAVINNGDEFGTRELALVSFGKAGTVTRERIPMTDDERYSTYRSDPLTILPSGAVVYAVLDLKHDEYVLKRYERGAAKVIGTSPTTTVGSVFDHYVEQVMNGSERASTTNTLFMHSSNKVIKFFGICEHATAMNLVPDVYACLSYAHNSLVLEKNGEVRTVFSFDELAIKDPRRFVQFETLSRDKSIAVVRMGTFGENNTQSPTYAYNIVTNRWALLTNKGEDRVLYLR